MFEYLESISITEGEQIKKTIQALFRQTCILQVKYDPATLVPKDNVQYEICVRHRHFIEDYLSVLGCELTHDAQEHSYCDLCRGGVRGGKRGYGSEKIYLFQSFGKNSKG